MTALAEQMLPRRWIDREQFHTEPIFSDDSGKAEAVSLLQWYQSIAILMKMADAFYESGTAWDDLC